MFCALGLHMAKTDNGRRMYGGGCTLGDTLFDLTESPRSERSKHTKSGFLGLILMPKCKTHNVCVFTVGHENQCQEPRLGSVERIGSSNLSKANTGHLRAQEVPYARPQSVSRNTCVWPFCVSRSDRLLTHGRKTQKGQRHVKVLARQQEAPS